MRHEVVQPHKRGWTVAAGMIAVADTSLFNYLIFLGTLKFFMKSMAAFWFLALF
jgi:phosphopantothenate synthetase